MSAAQALQAAIYARLSADAALTALIGTGSVRDHLQPKVDKPSVFLAGIESRDASTSSEKGEEHLITLQVRTGEGGNRMAGEIVARVRDLLDDAALTLSGATLVGILHRRTTIGRNARVGGHATEMVFRAVTE